MRRLIAAVAVVAGGLAAAPGSSHAGGWAVVSFDEQPELVAGEPSDVGFTLLRHGVTPESSEKVTFVLTDERGARHQFTAEAVGAIGHHVVTIDLPSSGDYGLTVLGEFIDIELGSLTVGSGSGGETSTLRWDALQWGTAALAVLMAALAGWDVLRPRRPAHASATA
jgi:hypothetical protein